MATIDDVIAKIRMEREATFEVDVSIFIKYKNTYFVDGQILNAPDINGCAIMTSEEKIKPLARRPGISRVKGRVVPERLNNELIDAMRSLGACDLEVFGGNIPAHDTP